MRTRELAGNAPRWYVGVPFAPVYAVSHSPLRTATLNVYGWFCFRPSTITFCTWFAGNVRHGVRATMPPESIPHRVLRMHSPTCVLPSWHAPEP